jgi:MYXO-CTERM domain-containing protein
VNGASEPGEGDLYRYEFDGSALDDVTATYGDRSATAQIHAGEGYVDSSNDIGCATTRGSPMAALLAILALGATRRRTP